MWLDVFPGLAFLLLAAGVSPQETYRVPPQVIVDTIDAPRTPITSLSPDRSHLLLQYPAPLPRIRELAEPQLNLGGLEFSPVRYAPVRRLAPREYLVRLELLSVEDGRERPVSGIPADARINNVVWSPDGRRIAFTLERSGPGELWIADVESAVSRQIPGVRINAVSVGWISFNEPVLRWVDTTSLIAPLLPDEMRPAPAARVSHIAPSIQETRGAGTPAMTFPGLLTNSHDEALFEHYATADLARITVGGQVTRLGVRGMVAGADPSPDGRYILVRMMHRPFSRIVRAIRFPERIVIIDAATGRSVRVVGEMPLAETFLPVSTGAVRAGPREIRWRADKAATLVWVEALDGGDPAQSARFRDEIFALEAPFDAPAKSIMKLAFRLEVRRGIFWGDDATALIRESWPGATARTWRIAPDEAGGSPKLLFERSTEEEESDPRVPITRMGKFGREVIDFERDGQSFYLRGLGRSPRGDQPFIEQFDPTSRRSERIWGSRAGYYEDFVSFIGGGDAKALIVRESPTHPGNFYVHDLDTAVSTSVTSIPSPSVHFTELKVETIECRRDDGLTFHGALYLPRLWSPAQGRLPTLFWIYARERASAKGGGSPVAESSNRFRSTRLISPWKLALMGYAVLDVREIPIVGSETGSPADTFIEQLVLSARAAIEELERRGITDTTRVAVGGESYGAYAAANLLAHTQLFRAGIALAGFYERSWQPFGFQGETRTLWQARSAYAKNSPLLFADQVAEPLLLIHGQLDQNVPPSQSERMYQAIKGLGGTARLVLLPYEDHGNSRARESVLHVFWEMGAWLDTHVGRAFVRAGRTE